MINDNFKATGELQVILRDENGNIKQEQTIKNLVVTAGKTFIASRMAGTASAVMSHMAVGSSTTAAAVGQTDLVAIIGSRVALSVAGGTASTNTVTYSAVFGAGVSTGAITEAGIFNASTAGTMLARTVFSVVNKDAGDSLTINWVVTVS